MCIIVHKPAGRKLEKTVYENCWSNNSDGAGFLVAKDGALIMEKGFFSLPELLKALEPYETENIVVHFRSGTMGGRTKDNCHPFMISEEVGFVHNGTIHKIDRKQTQYSDTWHFNELILKPLIQSYPTSWAHKAVKFLLEEYIGSTNKLVFMNNEGVVRIYNEEKGTRDHDGCWFSNTDYKFFRGVRGGHTTKTNFQSEAGKRVEGNASTNMPHANGTGFDDGRHYACDNCMRVVEKGKEKLIHDYTLCESCYDGDPTVKLFANECVA